MTPVQLQDLAVFATVAAERSFSKAAKKLHRTQPAVSQAIRRLEEELGDRLFDRSSRDGTLTEAGRLLQDYAGRLLTLASDAELAVRELQEVRRGRVVIGANEAAVHSLLPVIASFGSAHPQVLIDVRRMPSRQMAAALLDRTIDFGVLTFSARRARAADGLARPRRARDAGQPAPSRWRRASASRWRRSARETVIAHNDPSPARDRVLRLYERRHQPINIRVALPSLDGIKRAVEMGLGVAVLPRRVALAEIASGRLVAVKVPELSAQRHVRLVFRRAAELSHAADAFLATVRQLAPSVEKILGSPLSPPAVQVRQRGSSSPRPVRSDRGAGRSRPRSRRGTIRAPPAAATPACASLRTRVASPPDRWRRRGQAPASPDPGGARCPPRRR